MFFNKSFILFKVLIVSLQIWRTVTWNPALVEDRETCFEFHSLSLLWWTASSSPSSPSASAVWFSAAAHLTPCSVSHCILHYHGPINIHVTIQWSLTTTLTTALTTAQTHGGSGWGAGGGSNNGLLLWMWSWSSALFSTTSLKNRTETSAAAWRIIKNPTHWRNWRI